MGTKIFLLVLAIIFGYLGVWCGDALGYWPLTIIIGSVFALVATAVCGIASVKLFALEEGAFGQPFSGLTLFFGALLFGIVAAPLSDHSWGTPWIIILFISALPILWEIKELFAVVFKRPQPPQRAPIPDTTNVTPFKRVR
ncbi:MAG: hypothetical protein JWL75_493 [Parcubacteria group bacterium]|nr:hypothetical protein [Parcubacteria group bacterium]